MEKLKTYLIDRQQQIINDIETDKRIDTDNYHNVGRLIEIQKVLKYFNMEGKL